VAAKIACVGDSITYGYGLSNRSQQSWPAVLQTLLGSKHTVQNFGTSSCTLLKKGDKPYWNDANFSASDAFKPDVVVVMLGTNDAKPQNWSHKADFTGDYDSLIDHYRALGALVYVATPPPVYPPGAFEISPDVLGGEIVPLIRQIAANANAPLVEVFQALSGKPSFFPDTVHPNTDGSQLIAETVATAVQEGGFGGAAGSTGTGGSVAGAGGMAGGGGSTKGTGGFSTGAGGISGSGGSTRGTGGFSTSTGGVSTRTGGISGSGGISGKGGISTWTGGVPGAGGVSGSGGRIAQGGRSGGSGGAEGGADGGRGGEAGSSRAASGGSTGMGGGPAGSSGTTVKQTGNAGGCGCSSFGRSSVHCCEYLVALLLLTMLKRRQRN
jgi:acyl-CoA thioesterase-1